MSCATKNGKPELYWWHYLFSWNTSLSE